MEEVCLDFFAGLGWEGAVWTGPRSGSCLGLSGSRYRRCPARESPFDLPSSRSEPQAISIPVGSTDVVSHLEEAGERRLADRELAHLRELLPRASPVERRWLTAAPGSARSAVARRLRRPWDRQRLRGRQPVHAWRVSTATRRPDVVLFVNGIPLGVDRAQGAGR